MCLPKYWYEHVSICKLRPLSLCLCSDSVWLFTTQTAAQSPCPLWCMTLWLIEHKQGGDFGEFRKACANVIDDEMIRRDGMRSFSPSIVFNKKWRAASQAAFIWQTRDGKCHHDDYNIFDYYSLLRKRETQIKSSSNTPQPPTVFLCIRHAHYISTFRGVPVVHAGVQVRIQKLYVHFIMKGLICLRDRVWMVLSRDRLIFCCSAFILSVSTFQSSVSFFRVLNYSTDKAHVSIIQPSVIKALQKPSWFSGQNKTHSSQKVLMQDFWAENDIISL